MDGGLVAKPHNARAAMSRDGLHQLRIVTINGGSSSIKFAVFAAGRTPTRELSGQVERIGLGDTAIVAKNAQGEEIERSGIDASNHEEGANALAEWLLGHVGKESITGIGHRVVHGGVQLLEHQLIDQALVEELVRTQPLDLAHLPREIALIEVFQKRFGGMPQVACFDTAFHRDLPRIAQLLPIPREFDRAGVRKLGFHGLSYSYLMGELGRIAPSEAAGKVILAHLGSGASMAAVSGGRPVDTTMSFTPTAGLVMGTRPGDMDPGLLVYLMRVQNLSPEQMDQFISQRCGLLGVSETSSDMRDLLERRSSDVRAAEAVDLFCYQARRWIGAFAASMGGLDCLVFSAGIGEHVPQVRTGICQGLEFLGLRLDESKNAANAPLISTPDSRVAVRVIPTDEEIVIARAVLRLVNHEEK